MASFAELAAAPDPPLDALALALAAEFRSVDHKPALATLDALGDELRAATGEATDPAQQVRACGAVLADAHGFLGAREDYDHPDHSMLDVVLERRRGLPILLSVVYVEVARRAGVALAGFGLPGHFVCGHVGCDPPLLLDPFSGGGPVAPPAEPVPPWGAHAIALRMLNNLVAAYQRRGHLADALRAAGMRLELPVSGAHRETLEAELRALQARLN